MNQIWRRIFFQDKFNIKKEKSNLQKVQKSRCVTIIDRDRTEQETTIKYLLSPVANETNFIFIYKIGSDQHAAQLLSSTALFQIFKPRRPLKIIASTRIG